MLLEEAGQARLKGDFDDALTRYAIAQMQAEANYLSEPGDTGDDVIAALTGMSRTLSEMQRQDDAISVQLALVQAAEKIAAERGAPSPQHVENAKEELDGYWAALVSAAIDAENEEDFNKMYACHLRALEVAETLIGDPPASEHRPRLVISLMKAGDVERAVERFEEAGERWRRAESLLIGMAAEDADYEPMLASIGERLADLPPPAPSGSEETA